MASKSPSIYNPKPLKQRPFNDDYGKGFEGQRGSPLTADIDGNPLSAQIIAGRRVGGGRDVGITGSEAHRTASGMDIRSHKEVRSGSDLKGDFGRYTRSGRDRNIYIDESLPADTANRVFQHEFGHALDDMAYKIPTKGIKKELSRVYEDLNTGGWFKPGRGATPKGHGYKAKEVDAELMAEAIRAYMVDPNYIKTIAPKTAARIRLHTNQNPRINKAIQFNTIAPAVGAGLLGIISSDQ